MVEFEDQDNNLELEADELDIDVRLRSASMQLQSQLASVRPPETGRRAVSPWGLRLAGVGALVAAAIVSVLLLQTDDPSELDVSTPDAPAVKSPAIEVESEVSGFLPDVSADELVWGPSSAIADQSGRALTLGESAYDPSYNLPIRRMTDGVDLRFDRVQISSRQVENADGTLLLTYRDTEWTVIETSTLTVVGEVDAALEGEPHWDPVDPDVLRYFRGLRGANDLQLFALNVSTGEESVVADLNSTIGEVFPTAVSLRSNGGGPSADGQVWGVVVYDLSEVAVGVATFDRETGDILGSLRSGGESGVPVAVSVAPSGERAVVVSDTGLHAFDIGLTSGRRYSEGSNAGDFVVLADGSDGVVFPDFAEGSETDGFVVAVNLESFETFRLFDLYDESLTSVQVSGRGLDKPGWVVLSTYACRDEGAWTCDKVMAVELAEAGRILNLAHTNSCGENFWEQPEAVVNRSFTRVYFNTDNGSCGGPAHVLAISVPEFE